MRKVLSWGLMLAAAAVLGGCTASRTVIVQGGRPGPVAKAPGQVHASRAHTRNGVRFFERGQYRKAIQQFELAIAEDPANWEAHYYLGESYRELRDFDRCLVHYNRCRDLCHDDPNWVARVEFGVGVVFERRGDFRNARSHYELALVAVPDYGPAKNARAHLLAKRFKERQDDEDNDRHPGRGKKHND